jgi:hypothetical protein
LLNSREDKAIEDFAEILWGLLQRGLARSAVQVAVEADEASFRGTAKGALLDDLTRKR